MIATIRFQSKQQGAVGIILVVVIAALIFGVLVTALSGASTQNQFDAKTIPSLAIAQKALIAYAAGHPTRPGRLPCPDTNNDGVSNCVGNTSQIGRLPWKTLGIPDLRDGSGECLWYAVSFPFKENFVPLLTGPVNSDTNGIFTVVDAADNVVANNVIAVVFAPGPELSGAAPRTAAGNTRCGGNTSADRYLDAVAGVANNAVIGGGPNPPKFVMADPSNTFNDRLIFITPEQFFPSVERRVAGEIKAILNKYYSDNSYYPFANSYSDFSGDCTPGSRRGLIPLHVAASCPGLADWPMPLPSWFTNENWWQQTYYTLAPACAHPKTNCAPGSLLTVTNAPAPNNNKQALVIMAGRALAGQLRPSSNVSDYLDGPENTNGNDIYITQPASPTFNDMVVIVGP